jgi:hypothetical protein
MTIDINDLLDNIDQIPNSSQQLSTMEMILKANNLTIEECANLSEWRSYQENKPLYYLAIPTKVLRNLDEFREALDPELEGRIAELKNKNIEPEVLSELTPKNIVNMLSCITDYLLMTAANAVEIIHSNEPITRSTIDVIMRGILDGVISDDSLANISVGIAKKSIIAVSSTAFINNATKNIDKKVGETIKVGKNLATKYISKNLDKGLYNTLGTAAVSALSGMGVTLFTKDKEMPAIIAAAVIGYLSTGTFEGVLRQAIKKKARNYGWEVMNGKVALKNRDLSSFVNAYFMAKGMQQYVPMIMDSVVKTIRDYINLEIIKAKPKDAEILFPAYESISTYYLSNLSMPKVNSSCNISATSKQLNISSAILPTTSYEKNATALAAVALTPVLKFVTRVGTGKGIGERKL